MIGFRRAVLFLALAMSLLLLQGGCSKQTQLTPDQALERADTAISEARPREAVIYLKNALQSHPNDSQLRLELAKVYLELGNGSAAQIEIDKALRSGLEARAGELIKAQALLIQDEFEAVLETTADPTPLAPAQQATKTSLRGLAHLGLGQTEQAADAFDSALAIVPDHARATTGKARLLATLGDREQALTWVERALDQHPDFAPAWRLKADLARAMDDAQTAEAAYSQAIKHRYANADDRLQRALVRLAQNNLEGAETDVDKVAARYENVPTVSYLRGLISLRREQNDAARSHFLDVLKLQEGHLGATYFLGVLNAEAGNLEQAEVYLSRFVKARPQIDYAAIALGTVRIHNQDLAGAKAVLNPVLARNPDNLALTQLVADLNLAQGQGQAAEPLLRKVASHQPDSAEALTKLGMGLLMEGKGDEGRAILDQAAALEGNLPRAKILLVFSHIKAGDLDAALSRANELVDANPESAGALALKATVLAEREDFAAARKFYEQAWAIEPGHLIAGRGLARLDLQADKRDAAYQRYTETLAKHPGNVPVSLALAKLDLAARNLEPAQLRLREAIDAHPDDPRPRTLLAQLYQAVGRTEAALQVVESPSQQALANPAFLETAGMLHQRAAQYKQADKLFSRLVARVPESSQAHLYRGLALQGLNQPDQARRALAKAIDLDHRNRNARASLAGLEIRTQNFQAAQQQIDQLRRLSGSQAQALELQARYHAAQRQFESAAKAMHKLMNLQPTGQHAYALVDLQYLAGNRAQAFTTARNWLERNPDDQRVALLLADLLSQAGQTAKAQQAYESLLAQAPNNPIAHNNFANLLHASAPEQALEHARQAFELTEGQNPAIADTYGWILLDSQPNQALGILREAHQRAKGAPAITYHYAAALHENGFDEQARPLLAKVVKQDFKERDAAAALLERLGR